MERVEKRTGEEVNKMKIFHRWALITFVAILPYSFVQAQTVQMTVPMSGAHEVPPVATPAMGTATLTVDRATGTMSGSVIFSGLTSPATTGHIHHGAVGIDGPAIAILAGGRGSTAGTMIVPSFVLSPAQMIALGNNEFYINVHSQANPDGEIRGQIIFPAGSGSTEKTAFVDVKSGDFDPARPGREILALDTEGRIFISFDLATWMEVPGKLMKLLTGDFNGDGRDDIGGIGEEGKIFFTTDFGASWTEIPSPQF